MPFDGAEIPDPLQDRVAVSNGHASKCRLAPNICGQSLDDEVSAMIAQQAEDGWRPQHRSVNEAAIGVVLDGMDLTDAQWAVLEPSFRAHPRADGRGRPWSDPRAVLNGVLWVLRTGAPWHDLPRRYPPYQTCHRRFQQ